MEKWEEAAREFKKAIDLRRNNYNLAFPEAQKALDNLLKTYPDASVAPNAKTVVAPGSASGRFVGKVKTYFPNKGYGFLKVEGDEDDLFFHINEVKERDSVEVGECLEYSVGQSRRGLKAINLKTV